MNWFSSPMGYLYFYSVDVVVRVGKSKVLVPYGVSIFLFGVFNGLVTLAKDLFSSPMGYLYFYSGKTKLKVAEFGSRPLWGIYISIRNTSSLNVRSSTAFSSPMGYLYFYSILPIITHSLHICSRPLWGIYISIRKQ